MEEEKSTTNVDLINAKKCISSFISTKLFLHSQKQDYIRKTNSSSTESIQHSDTGEIYGFQNGMTLEGCPDPNIIESDLKYFKELFSKLKFSYIEQETKERYLRAILDDPILIVEHKDNIELGKKENVNETCKELEQTLSRVCDDYETMMQKAIEADHMLKEIEKMETEIKELKDNEQSDEQNLSLKDSLSFLSSQTKKLSKLKKDTEHLQNIYKCKKKQLDETIDEVKKRENEKRCCEAFAKEALHVKRMSSMKRYKKEYSGLWYRSLLDLQIMLLGIKNFQQDHSQERIDLTFKTHKGCIPIRLYFENGRFHDGHTDVLHIEEILCQAKQRNDPLFFINTILFKT
ncbi:hypothetical protein PCANB_000696 [Pneumocystis canis]|nr:hypothetical protein PCANB_000696 [Pneumocystis canis]